MWPGNNVARPLDLAIASPSPSSSFLAVHSFVVLTFVTSLHVKKMVLPNTVLVVLCMYDQMVRYRFMLRGSHWPMIDRLS